MEKSISIVFIPIFLASLAGSPHCAGMCGGFVGLYSHNAQHKVMPHVLYSLGRLVTYLLLGTAAAYFGQTVDGLAPVAKLSALVVGAGLIIAGLIQLGFGRIVLFTRLGENVAGILRPLVAPLIKSDAPIKPFIIGLVTTLLPCGWLYTFVALALASADITAACFVMTVFWLGTLPIMISLGVMSQALTARLGRYRPTLVAILLIIGGLLSVNIHLQHADHNQGSHHHHHH